MRRFLILALVAAFLAVPATALAAEPYSSSTTSVEPPTPGIIVAASGLTVEFTATHVTAACTWDFGDSGTGEGNPVSHTYAADGEYTVTATCGDTVLTRTLTFAADLSFTGFGLVPFGIAIVALVLLGATALAVSRKVRANR
ncbi:MAG: PKD domain-containing protein [Actinomycetota bacterium]